MNSMHLRLGQATEHPLARRWGRPLAFALTVVTTVLGFAFFLVAGTWAGWDRPAFDDFLLYRDATARILGGGGWYLPHQLAGPYEISHGDVLYPPVSAWFFAPWLVLPPITFTAIPTAIVAWFVVRARPAAWTWPILAFCLAYPITLIYIVFANPSVWIAAFVALGLRFGWPGVLVLLKPSLAPFALIGIRSRGWWVGLALLAIGSLPFLAQTLDYPRVILNSRGGGLLYSVISIPLVVLPLVAWLGRRDEPARASTADAARVEDSHR
jgi:hypothetical protein